MKRGNQKLRILYLQDIFSRRTDENHVYSAEQLCDVLMEDYGIPVERKAIYGDIEALRDYGMDIINTRSPVRGYYLKSRKFEPAEVRLLTDAVLAAKFISPKNTKSLVYKIGSLMSEEQEETLRRQVYVNSSVKCRNEELYDIISVLSEAIERKLQVQFDYSRRKLEKRFIRRFSARTFTVNPYALIWSNDHYYLVCNNPKYSNLMHVRLDRIANIRITNTPYRHFSAVSPYKGEFDSADYSNRLFNMFSGEQGEIKLRCNNRLIDDILERFGENIPLMVDDEDNFIVRATVELSDGLVSWIMQFGTDMKVMEPAELKNAVRDKADDISMLYE